MTHVAIPPSATCVATDVVTMTVGGVAMLLQSGYVRDVATRLLVGRRTGELKAMLGLPDAPDIRSAT